MNLIPTEVTGITHPLISSLYVKKTATGKGKIEQVLVANTSLSQEAFDAVMDDDLILDLMDDLSRIRKQAARNNGPISLVEIRYAS